MTAALLVGGAFLLLGPRRATRTSRLVEGRRSWPPSARVRQIELPLLRQPPAVALVVAAVGVLTVIAPAPVGVVALLSAAGVGFLLARDRAHRRQQHDAVSKLVAEAAGALAADLAAGHTPMTALAALAADLSGPPVTAARVELADRLGRVVAAARLGGDVPAGLRALSIDGAERFADIAAGWQVAEQTGAPLGVVLEQVADGVRRDLARRRHLDNALAGARASARLLAILPLVGILFGAGLGVSPLGFLLGSWPGRTCLVTGIGLSLIGVTWTNRIADRVRSG